jgi:hypothetical protein
MKKSAHHLLYLITKGLILGFESLVLVLTFIIGYSFLDFERAVYGVQLGILIMPLAWKFFDWPTKRREELQKIEDIYEEERSKF